MRRRLKSQPTEAPKPVLDVDIDIGPNPGIISLGNNSRNIIINTLSNVPYTLQRPERPRAGRAEARSTTALSNLLRAQRRVVRFTGREAIVQRLLSWCDDVRGPEAAALLLHAPGGQGKTRLAFQVASLLPRSWSIWEATYQPSVNVPLEAAAPSDTIRKRSIVIVDYAERWPSAVLGSLIADLARQRRGRQRVLLISRAAGEWWDTQRHDFTRNDYVCEDDPLPALHAGATGDRRAVYLAACEAFAEVLGVADPENIPVPADLDDEAYGLMLTVQMSALAAVDARSRGEQSPQDPGRLSEYLLDREYDHWQKRFVNADARHALDPLAMAQTVFAATLVGRVTYEQACDAVTRAAIESGLSASTIVRAHAAVYPAGAAGTYLEPLYPDRLGEDFLASRVPQPGSAGDPWIVGALDRLTAPADDGTFPVWARHVITVLVETARRWQVVESTLLYPLIRRHPGLAFVAGGPVLAALPGLPDADPDMLAAVESCFPARDIELDVGIAAFVEARLPDRLAAASTLAERAALHQEVSVRMFNVRWHPRGVGPAQDAVEAYRLISEHAGPAEKPGVEFALARALDTCGIHLQFTEQREEALAATREAIEVLESLDGSDRAVAAVLCRARANLVARTALPDDDVLGLAEAAVDACRRFQVDFPGEKVELSGALDNLGWALSRRSRFEEAVAATGEALEIRRAQAEAEPDVYMYELVRTLGNYAFRLEDADRVAEAETARREAVRLQRVLTEINPEWYRGSQAAQLMRLAQRSQSRQEYEAASAEFTEAIGHYRAAGESGAGNPLALAFALDQRGIACERLGRRDDAVTSMLEAVQLYRARLEDDRTTVLPLLARTASNLGIVASYFARHRDVALQAFEEAITLYGELIETGQPHQERRSAMLHQLGLLRYQGQEYAEAAEVYDRAAWVAHAREYPDQQLHLAGALRNRGMALFRLGEHATDAMGCLAEAIDLYRILAESDRATVLPALAVSNRWLARAAEQAGMMERALDAARTSIELFEELATQDPAAHAAGLSEARNLLDSLSVPR